MRVYQLSSSLAIDVDEIESIEENVSYDGSSAYLIFGFKSGKYLNSPHWNLKAVSKVYKDVLDLMKEGTAQDRYYNALLKSLTGTDAGSENLQ